MNAGDLRPGVCYDVDPAVARFLMASAAAEPDDLAGPALVIPTDPRETLVAVVPEVRDVAAEDDDLL